LQKEGYLLLGASNQSGVAKGQLTAADAEACFAETAKQLGVEFTEVKYCPHKVPPIGCYCRKPGPGMGVELIVKYKLDPKQCIFVGDQTTDKSFAEKDSSR
jgi:HAD superfamily hydrolase (TIGR01662 family)